MKDSDDPIASAAALLRSLSAEIPLVQIFKGKWSSIQAKLTDLDSQLTDFSDFPTALSNPLSLDFLLSVSLTLSEAVAVACRCQTTAVSEGKLRTQSDVDAVLAKLDLHLRDAEVLFKSGVLHDCTASSSTSKKEAVRAECRMLVTRLQIGGGDSKRSAMEALLTLLQEDDKNVMIAVAQGIVPVLVKLLDSSSFEMKENAVAAVAAVATVESSRSVLAAEGLMLLNHLVRALESGSVVAKEKACVALQALSFSKDNARVIASRSGVSSLLDICHEGTPDSRASAAGVLRNLAAFAENKENFIEENGVEALLELASSGTALAQENVFACLCYLVSDSESQKVKVAREGGITCLLNFLDSRCGSDRSVESAVELLAHLASSAQIAEAIVAEGCVPRIVEVMVCGVLGVRIQAAKAVYELGFCSRTRKEIGECGCIPPLIKMLDGKAAEEKEAAAKALSVLLLCAENRKIFRRTEGVISSAVQMLNPLMKLDKKYPVAVLATLVHLKKCKKQMVAAGACVHLQKLVDLEVEGSQKLLESLGRSNIWGVFSRS